MKRLILLSALILMPFLAASKTTVIWGTDVWDNFTNTDGSGFYHQLMAEIFPANEYQLETQYFPWKRSLKYLAQGKIDTTGSLPLNNTFYYSEKPILTETIFAVLRKEDESKCCDLKGLTGSYRHGYDQDVFYEALPQTIKGIGVDSVAQGMELLLDGKIDFYVDISNVLNYGLSEVDPQAISIKAIGYYKLHWAFTHSAKGLAIKQHFDQSIAEMINNGELEQLYLKYGVSMPTYNESNPNSE